MEISSRKQNVYMADLIIFRFQWYQPVGCLEGREIRKPGSQSMGFSRQEFWSSLPFPSPAYLPDPGIKPVTPALQVDSLLLSHWGSPFSSTALLLKPGIVYCAHIALYLDFWTFPWHKSMEHRVSRRPPKKTSRVLLQRVSRP